MSEKTTEELVEVTEVQEVVTTTTTVEEVATDDAPAVAYAEPEAARVGFSTGQIFVLSLLVLLNVIVVILAILALTGRLSL